AAQGAKVPLQFAQNWIGYMAANGGFAREYTETSYNIDFSFGESLWDFTGDALFDLHQAEVKGLASNDTALAGAAIVLSAKLFQELADTYGDIPYSQAFQVNKYPHPAYDRAQDIYASLLLRLDTAINYLSTTVPNSFVKADLMNGGDATKWIKFANTLKLRLLIRQSEVQGFSPAAEIAKIIDKGGVLGAGESVSVNPGYSNETDKQSPFYANYGFTATGNIAAPGWNANAYIVNILSSTNDPRLSRFFTPVGTAFVGDRYGDDPGNVPNSANSSYFGPGLSGSPTQDQWVYPSFESMFLEAEAIARGWMPGDPKTAFEAAITESFVWLGVPNATVAAANYIAANPIANWTNAGTTAESQAAFVVYQKYIALCCIDPLEAWADQRRLNFLKDNSYLSANTSRIANTIPVRLLYPQSEYTANSASVLKEGTINQFTSKLFWQP
ncbi:MAG: SusD/RagB family nutrient-binding outer membrane lipoprotein, partial [Bacteroidota bacterium]|nr:SusD/RagB family nutrient-binding outer membrane lipoprotein [Bacteroidota bacterium]